MKNLTKVITVLMALFVAVALAGCGAGDSGQDPANADTITITDHAGNTVTVPKNIDRIAVCDIYPLPSVLTIFFDSAEKIVGMPDVSMSAAQNGLLGQLYPEILNAETNYINETEVNVEELMKLDPDVVFYSAGSVEEGQQLRDAGFNAVAISANKWEYDAIETLNNWISLLSEMFPENDKAEKVSAYSNEIYNMIQERVGTLTDDQKAKLFFLFKYSDTNMMTSGKQFFGQWWADAVGAKNAAEELSQDNSVAVSMEQVYKWNPDKILITNFTPAQPEDLYSNAIGNYDWSGISAVQSKSVYKMPLGMYRSYTCGVDTPITLLWLAKTVYPELFEDINVTEKVIDYYKSVFGVTLTAEQAESIFAPVSDAAAGF